MVRSKGLVALAGLAAAVFLTTAAASGKVAITFSSWAGGVEKDAIEKSIKEFERRNPGIDVKTFYAADYNDKILAMYAAGKPPDVMYVSQDVYSEWALRQMLMDITPLYRNDKDLTRPGYLFQPQEDERMYIEGKTYGIGCGFGSYFTYLNPNTWLKAGLKIPSSDPDDNWTFDDFLAQSKKLTQGPPNKPDVWGVEPGLGWWLGNFSWLYSIGPVFNDKRTEFNLNSDLKMQEGLQKLVNLVAKQGVVPKSINVYDALAKGKLGMFMAGSWELATLDGVMNKAKAPLELAPLPALGPKPGVMLQGHMHCISKGTRHQKEAWKLLKWVSSPEHQLDMVQIGLWPPGRGDLTTPDAVRKWMKPGIHPKSYPDVGVKYTIKYGKALYSPPGFGKANSYWWEAMDPVFRGQKDLKTVLPALVKQMNTALAQGRKRVGK